MSKKAETTAKVHEWPATTLEARENQLVSLAMNCVEQRIKEGKATSQELVYFLKAGSPDERLKRQLLTAQAELAKAKADAIKAEQQNAELIAQAIAAFREYNGVGYEEYDEEDVY